MAVAVIQYVFPKTVPLGGGEIQLSLNQNPSSPDSSCTVYVNGVACPVLGSRLNFVRALAPPGAAGVVSVGFKDNSGTATPLAGALTYASNLSRLYLTRVDHGNPTVNPTDDAVFRPPATRHAATAGVAVGGTLTGATEGLGWDKPPGAVAGFDAGTVVGPTALGSVGGFFAARAALPSPALYGLRSIAAGTWTFAAVAYQWIGSSLQGWDKLCLYVFRPSTGAVVGMIYDGTTDYSHPSGRLSMSNTRQVIRASFSGAQVNGIQDGDRLALEWYACADANTPAADYVGYAYYGGTHEPTGAAGSVSVPTSDIATYLDAPGNLFAQVVSVGAVTPSNGPTTGGTAVTVGGSGFATLAAAHRYWRIYTRSTTYGNTCAFAEIELRASAGGADQTGSGTASESSMYAGNAAYNGAKAVDNNAATMWVSSNAGGPFWWSYDFGSAKFVSEVSIQARPEGAYAGQFPDDFDVQFSDNGADWTTAKTFGPGAASGVTAGTVKTFTVSGGALAVTIGGVAATNVVVVNDTTITCNTPAHAAGVVDVVVGSATLAAAFTYVVPIAVTFDGLPATNVTEIDANTLDCDTPAHAPGAVDVVATFPDSVELTAADGYTYEEPEIPPPEPPPSGTGTIKPIVRYRTFRSDDLTKPLFGPVKLEIGTVAMKREGSSFEAKAPSLSLNRTGETYDLDRFPGLRGLL